MCIQALDGVADSAQMTLSAILQKIYKRGNNRIQNDTKTLFRKVLKSAFLAHLSNVCDGQENEDDTDINKRKLQRMRSYLLGDATRSFRTANDSDDDTDEV